MKQAFKIVHLNASTSGGAFVAAQRISDALNQVDGVESIHFIFEGQRGSGHALWASNWFKKKWAFLLHALEKLDFLRFEKSKTIRFAFSHALTGIDITKIQEIQNADVIHLHWVNKGFLSLDSIDALIQTGKRIVWTCHDVWPFTGGCYHPRGCNHFTQGCGNCQYLKSPSVHDLSARIFKKKQSIWGNSNIHFVTPSNWLEQTALKSSMLQHPSEKITTIPNGVDVSFFTVPSSAEKIQSREFFGLREGKTTIMFSAANLTNRAKGYIEFLAVCSQLQSMGMDIQALVVGDLRGQEFAADILVEYAGFISDPELIRKAYWASDLYITTSHEENLPTTIMESLSCGVPVGAFEVGGIPEMIVDGETGVLAGKLDVNQLSLKVVNFMKSAKESGERIRENCKNFAVNHYSDAVIANDYLEIYRK